MTHKENFKIPAAMESMMNYLGIDMETSCEIAALVMEHAIARCLTCPVKAWCADHTKTNSALCPNMGRFGVFPKLAYWPEWFNQHLAKEWDGSGPQ